MNRVLFVVVLVAFSAYYVQGTLDVRNVIAGSFSAVNVTYMPGLAFFNYTGSWVKPATPPHTGVISAMFVNTNSALNATDLYVAFNATLTQKAAIYRYRNTWTKLGEFDGNVRSMTIDPSTTTVYAVGYFTGGISSATVTSDLVATRSSISDFPKTNPKKIVLYSNNLYVVDEVIAPDNFYSYNIASKSWSPVIAATPQQYVLNVVAKRSYLYVYGLRYVSRVSSAGASFESLYTVDQDSSPVKHVDANDINGDTYILFNDDSFRIISRTQTTFTKRIDGSVDYFWISASLLFVVSKQSKFVRTTSSGQIVTKPLNGGVANVALDGSTWSQAFGGGLNAAPNYETFAYTDNMAYVAGNFDQAYGATCYGMMGYDALSSTWLPLSTGLDYFDSTPDIRTMYMQKDGYLSTLFLGGNFRTSNGQTINSVAIYDTTSDTITALGQGVSMNSSYPGVVNALTYLSFSNELYVGGSFKQAGLTTVSNIAKWNNRINTWYDVGAGVDGVIYALEYDDYYSNIYLAGNFVKSSDQRILNIGQVAYGTTTILRLGNGVNDEVYTIWCEKKNIYIGGKFTIASDVKTGHVAVWKSDSSTWSPLDCGGTCSDIGIVYEIRRILDVLYFRSETGFIYSWTAGSDFKPVSNMVVTASGRGKLLSTYLIDTLLIGNYNGQSSSLNSTYLYAFQNPADRTVLVPAVNGFSGPIIHIAAGSSTQVNMFLYFASIVLAALALL